MSPHRLRRRDRYRTMFLELSQEKAGAFIPFLMLGDPDPETSARLLDALVEGGADGVELGIPFSDPIADGPTIQAAGLRALDAGVTPLGALGIVREFRERHPDVPIGILTYANLVLAAGLDGFYAGAAEAGVDSVLVADVPAFEAEPFAAAARAAGVAPVMILPPATETPLSDETLERIAKLGGGYTYCVTRPGVTGASEELTLDPRDTLEKLASLGAPPPVFGFGISRPEHVAEALRAGAAGAISGSAIVRELEAAVAAGNDPVPAVRGLVERLEAATRRSLVG